MSSNKIILYPSNWLYNAGVIGLLSNLDVEFQGENIKSLKPELNKDGTVSIFNKIFNELNMKERFIEGDSKISIYRKGHYRNFITTDEEKAEFIDFARNLVKLEKKGACGVCNHGYYLPVELRQKKFLNRNKEFNFAHNTILGPTINKFPNAFWNNSIGIKICDLCNFIILHHHLALIFLSNKEQIFINAPSFRVMYELNKLVRESFGSKNKFEARSKRELLATSVIEYTNRIQTSLGIWSSMNIEIVTIKKDLIEFYSLPYNVTKLISDREIASILSDLGEYSVYNKVLDGKYERLIAIANSLIKLSTKEELSNNDKNFVNSIISNRKNQNNLTSTANKILKLYALIENKLKRN